MRCLCFVLLEVALENRALEAELERLWRRSAGLLKQFSVWKASFVKQLHDQARTISTALGMAWVQGFALQTDACLKLQRPLTTNSMLDAILV